MQQSCQLKDRTICANQWSTRQSSSNDSFNKLIMQPQNKVSCKSVYTNIAEIKETVKVAHFFLLH